MKYLINEVVDATPKRLLEGDGIIQDVVDDLGCRTQMEGTGALDGYEVTLDGGYKYWVSDEDFRSRYKELGDMTFGMALVVMEGGSKVYRRGWNDDRDYIYVILAPHGDKDRNVIRIVRSGGVESTWISHADMFYDDWVVRSDD